MDLEVNGIRRAVNLAARPGAWVATVDGRRSLVDAHRAGDRWSLLIGPEGGGRRSYEVAVEGRGPDELRVSVNGHVVAIAIPHLRRFGNGPGRDRDSRAAGPLRIVAPMPGRIVKVLVGPDAAVDAGQPLVIVEAMKMENEMRSPKAGRVAAVMVSEGMLVEAGTALLIVQPEIPGAEGRKAR